VQDNKKFAEKFAFTYPLLSDTKRELGVKYGAADAPTCAARELPGRRRRPVDDRGDLLERHPEHVVEDEGEPLGRRQRLEHDQQGEHAEDRIGDRNEFQKAGRQSACQPQVRHRGNTANRRLGKDEKQSEGQGQRCHAFVAGGDRNGIEQQHAGRYRLGK